MNRRLPSLNQLQVFEAAARHGSFKAAADELCVTQAAISHQIKALEETLGQPLFHRGIREVRLLDRAAPLAAQLTRSLDEIGSAVEALTGPVAALSAGCAPARGGASERRARLPTVS